MSGYRPYSNAEQFPEAIKHLLIVNVLLFAVQNLLPQYNNVIVGHYLFAPAFQPWQIITHMFAHADVSHIFFNMFNLWMFGKILANMWGTKRFLFFYFTCGLVAFFVHQIYLFMNIGFQPQDSIMLGASGAVYGVLVAFATLFPNTQLMLLFPPIPLKAKYLIGGFLVMDVIFGFTGRATGVAHFAHIGGAVAGFLVVKYWQKNSKTFY